MGNPKKTIRKLLLAVLTLAVIFNVSSSTAFAQEEDYVHPDCSQRNLRFVRRFCTFRRDPLALGHNISLTVVDASKSMLDVATMAVAERNFDQLDYCTAVATGENPQLPASMQTDDDCADLRSASILTGRYGYAENNISHGSLIGLANAAQDVAFNEPVPINLAYYAKHTASKIPVVNNTAFAQTSIAGDFILGRLVGAWEAIRNISYGILSLVMIIIGVMIMIRHKINPQTVVTIQTAIPRIVISVLLITFSYPIGALAIALITPLSALAVGLLPISEVAQGNVLPMSTYIAKLSFLPLVGGAGMAIMILVVVMLLVGIFVLIKVLLQLIISYMKIIYNVLTAPLIFAWSAAPGNEQLVTDWFKKLAVNVVTIPAMVFGLNLGVYLAITFVNASAEIEGAITSGTGIPIAGAFQAGFFAPIIVIIVFWQVGKLPQMIEEGVLGKKRR